MKSFILFFIGALFIRGLDALTCPDDEEERTECPRRSEPTCSDLKVPTKLLTCKPQCYCKGNTVREEFTQLCYPKNDCPDYSFMLAIFNFLGLEVPSKQIKLTEGVINNVQSVIPEEVPNVAKKVVSKVTGASGLLSNLWH